MNNKLIKNIAILAVVYIGGVYVYKMWKKGKDDAASSMKPTSTAPNTAAQPQANFSNMSAKWECPEGEDKYQVNENFFYCKPKGYTKTHNSRKVERAPANG